MKDLNASQPLAGGSATSRFQATKAMALTLAPPDPELLEPELIAWRDRTQRNDLPCGRGSSCPPGRVDQ